MQSGLPADLLIELHETMPPDVREEMERFVRECPKAAAWLLGTRAKTVRLELKVENVNYSLGNVSQGFGVAVTQNEAQDLNDRSTVIISSPKEDSVKGFSRSL